MRGECTDFDNRRSGGFIVTHVTKISDFVFVWGHTSYHKTSPCETPNSHGTLLNGFHQENQTLIAKIPAENRIISTLYR